VGHWWQRNIVEPSKLLLLLSLTGTTPQISPSG